MDNKQPVNALALVPHEAAVKLSMACRKSVTLQSYPPATVKPVTPVVDRLLSLIPEYAIDLQPSSDNVRSDNREWLAIPPVTVLPKTETSPVTVAFGDPPAGLCGVERLLWPTLGRACGRASLWLFERMVSRSYMLACDMVGIQPFEVDLCKAASPLFLVLFDRVDAIVKSNKLERTKDTLHALANGDKRKSKQVLTRAGEVVELHEDIISEKALTMELAALAPQEFGPAAAAAGGVQPLSITIVAPSVAPPAVAASAAPGEETPGQPTDIDYVDV